MPQAIQSTPAMLNIKLNQPQPTTFERRLEQEARSVEELTKVRRSTLLHARSFPPGPERNYLRQIALSLRSLFANEAWLEAHADRIRKSSH
jgi:hypothetical protein